LSHGIGLQAGGVGPHADVALEQGVGQRRGRAVREASADRIGRSCRLADLDGHAGGFGEDGDLLGDGEEFLAREHVRLVLMAVLGQGECGDRGDVGGIDRRVAPRAYGVDDVSAVADGR
jgi:hypothetical protein